MLNVAFPHPLVDFCLENSPITVTITNAKDNFGAAYYRFIVRGSDADRRYRKESERCYVEYPGFMVESFAEKVEACLAAHSDAFYAPYLYHETLCNHADYSDFIKHMEAFSGEARETYHYKQLTAMIPLKSSLALGAAIPDFTMPDSSGNNVNLHTTISGNRYTLVDFWASWCGPCRHEFGTIKELYAKYHDQGLEVMGVTMDEEPERWKEAVRDEAIRWINVIDQEGLAKTV